MVYILCDLSERQQTEAESVRKMNEDTTVRGHVQVTLVDDTVKLQAANNTSRSQVRCVSNPLRVHSGFQTVSREG